MIGTVNCFDELSVKHKKTDLISTYLTYNKNRDRKQLFARVTVLLTFLSAKICQADYDF